MFTYMNMITKVTNMYTCWFDSFSLLRVLAGVRRYRFTQNKDANLVCNQQPTKIPFSKHLDHPGGVKYYLSSCMLTATNTHWGYLCLPCAIYLPIQYPHNTSSSRVSLNGKYEEFLCLGGTCN